MIGVFFCFHGESCYLRSINEGLLDQGYADSGLIELTVNTRVRQLRVGQRGVQG